MKRAAIISAIVAFALLLSACGASTAVQTMWKDEAFSPKETPLNKVLIMGAYQRQSAGLAFEAEMKKQFSAKGVACGGSLDYFKPGTQITKDELYAYIQDKGYDAVLVSRMVDSKTKVNYSSNMAWGGQRGAWGASRGAWGMSTTQVTTYDIVTVESDLFTASDDRLVWVATSEVFDPADFMDGIKSFAPTIVHELVNKQYFVRSK